MYRVTIAIAHVDVMHHDFKELTTAGRCFDRLVAAYPHEQIRLWSASSVRNSQLVNARMMQSHN